MALGGSKMGRKGMNKSKSKSKTKKKVAVAKNAGLKGKQNKLPAFLKNKIKKKAKKK